MEEQAVERAGEYEVQAGAVMVAAVMVKVAEAEAVPVACELVLRAERSVVVARAVRMAGVRRRRRGWSQR